MRSILLCWLFFCVSMNNAQSAIVFSAEQVGGSNPIVLGNSAVFNVFIASNSGEVSFRGIELIANAADPGLTRTATIGGRFIAGTSDFFPQGSGGWAATPADPLRSVSAFTANSGSDLTLNTRSLLGTISITTLGATPGTYNLGFTGINAIGAGVSSVPVFATSFDLSYTITAVPEPSTLVLLCLVGTTVSFRLWSKRRRLNR